MFLPNEQCYFQVSLLFFFSQFNNLTLIFGDLKRKKNPLLELIASKVECSQELS